MYHLHKWQIKDSNLCSECDVVETTIHAIYECPIAKETMENLNKCLRNITDIEIKISDFDCLFGVEGNEFRGLGEELSNVINTILIIIKRKLILQRESKFILTEEMINKIILDQKSLEKYNANRTKTSHKFNKRWTNVRIN